MQNFNRTIFTDSKPTLGERLLDWLLATVIGFALSAVILHSMGALFA